MESNITLGAIGDHLERDGFALLPAVFAAERVRELLDDLSRMLAEQSQADGSIRSRGPTVFAARNLLRDWPMARDLAQEPALRDALVATLGPGCGLVRGLFFDKPPGESWTLPWHKDLTIAVRSHRLPSASFSKPTVKAGVPHVEAPQSVLQDMLAVRIHLDDVTDENGPLLVAPGSHRLGKQLGSPPASADIRPIHAAAGDVLVMRPLLAHRSGYSYEGTHRHRRIVHLEVAAGTPLPDGYAWHEFWPMEV